MMNDFFRRKRKFLGIRSHPSFVKAITVAFETSAVSLEGLLRSGEGNFINFNFNILEPYTIRGMGLFQLAPSKSQRITVKKQTKNDF